jgi:hypothetical protein
MQESLESIAEHTRSLSALLRGLPQPSQADLALIISNQDERGRRYDERYLCELGREMDRLGQACKTVAEAEVPEEAGPDLETSRGLVRKLAKVFSECFELEATAAEDSPFSACLELLDQVTGYAIGHEPEFLARVLGQPDKGNGSR